MWPAFSNFDMNAISPLSTSNFETQNFKEEFPGLMHFWNSLTQDDKDEYFKLKQSFHNGQQNQHPQKTQIFMNKDHRNPNFYKELAITLNYIERDNFHREERSIICGVAFAGPYICVNTRQLKSFIGRCKSSINGSFQQMGYSALRTKAKARNCITTIIKLLKTEQIILRQWTVRGASEKAQICFISSFPTNLLPDITKDDLLIEDKLLRIAKPVTTNKKINKTPITENPQFSLSPIIKELKKVSTNTASTTVPSPFYSLNLSSASAVINSFFANKKMNDSHSSECLSNFDDSEWNLVPKALSDDEYNEFNESNFWDMPLTFQTSRINTSAPSIADDFLSTSSQWSF